MARPAPEPLVPRTSRYEDCVAAFHWPRPERFNMAEAICDRHARRQPDAPAIITPGTGVMSFRELARQANRLANVLQALGVAPGDAVAIHLPQCPETAVAHVACYKLGAIALPLFSLFGPEALAHRIGDSGASVLLTCSANLERLSLLGDPPQILRHVLCIDGEGDGIRALAPLLASASDRFSTRDTAAEDPALLIYTSGTTGAPKGALHAHRCLLGHLPGVELPHSFFPQPGDRQWTPADWAWIGGLMDVLMPTLFHGLPVVAQGGQRFDPEAAFALMAREGVRNAFLPPTALRMMQQVPQPARFGHRLRSVASGGESLGDAMIAWGQDAFGLTISEFYGQTEVNLVVGNCPELFPVRPGSMGRPIPGHDVAVIDEAGQPLPVGEVGFIAVRRPDPAMFLRYWNRPDATREKFIGEWCVLGDLGHVDDEGYYWFKSRSDDVISSAGYRIGPAEVEACLMRHPEVALAGVIGAPDPVRGEVVTAYVVPAEGVDPDEALADRLSQFVRERLSAHEYPRRVRFIAEMPLTVTGKLRRNDLRELERRRTD